jgi:DNA-binding transcriptional LysR family regulator
MKSWDDLRYFLAVARNRTLAGAARELGVTHSTVFRRVLLLEERLGSRVFERLPGGYELTDIGKGMLPIAVKIDKSMNLLVRRASGADMRLSGELRVTTTDTLAFGLLNRHLKQFGELYPDIHIQLIIQNRFLSLSNREADLAIRPSVRLHEGEVVGRMLSEIAAALYASRAYTIAHGRPKSLAELKRHKIITGDESLQNTVTVKWLMRHARSENVVYRSNSLVDQLRALQGGFGVAAMPCFLADPDDRLVRLFPPEPKMANKLWRATVNRCVNGFQAAIVSG